MNGLVRFGVPLEFILFAATLLGVALFHRHALAAAVSGLAIIALYKLFVTGFDDGSTGLPGLGAHLQREWVVLTNLGLLLTGFAILTRHFEESRLPDLAPRVLPHGWGGGLVLLCLVFIASGFLDNIASALIGATIASHVYNGRVHIGFLAAIVAAANAGGAGSVVGDTTTTMMWLDGKSPLDVLHGYVGATAALATFSVPAAMRQHRYEPIGKHAQGSVQPDWVRLAIVVLILVAAVAANVTINIVAPRVADLIPVIGIAVWVAIGVGAIARKTDWRVLRAAALGAVFLLSLVLAASLMPVKALPDPGWHTAFGLGFVSAVFDNIPLTALALHQGGYDWGMLAYAVGFGGSMIWFGSSAGVAVSNLFPQAKSVGAWLGAGWWVPVSYVVGFLTALAIVGWRPET